MRQDDDVKGLAGPRDAVNEADDGVELGAAEELSGRQRSDRNHQSGTKYGDLPIQMRPAAGDFVGVRNAIAAALVLPGEAANYGSNVNAATKVLLSRTNPGEPLKKTFAGGIGKRLPVDELVRTGCLADQNDAGVPHIAGHRLAFDVRAESAGAELLKMLIERIRRRRDG